MTSDTLFSLTEELVQLEALLTETGGELSPDVEAWMEQNAHALSDKADSVAFYLKSCEVKQTGFQKVAQDLTHKAKVEENKITRLKEYIRLCLDRMGTRKLEGEIWTLALQKNGGRPALKLLPPYDTNPIELPTEFQVLKVEADRTALRLAAEQGRTQGIAELLPLGDHVSVR